MNDHTGSLEAEEGKGEGYLTIPSITFARSCRYHSIILKNFFTHPHALTALR